MPGKLRYLIDIDKCLIIEYYSGVFNADEFIEFKTLVGRDKDYNPNFNILHDFRETEFSVGINGILKYVTLISENAHYVGNRKSVMLTSTPNQVVVSLQFDMLKQNLPISVKVCSTFRTALAFLQFPICKWNQIMAMAEELKSSDSKGTICDNYKRV